jgi:hypothetical protein
LKTWLKVITSALTQKFETLNVNAINSTSASPSCEICGISGHVGVDCQLGSAINGVEQMNYAQYNQGMRQNQKFIKIKIPMDKKHQLAMQSTKESSEF